MYYHYYESDYAENSPEDFLFEAESDEKALEFVSKDMSYCVDKGYDLDEITEPKIEKDTRIQLTYDFIRTVKQKEWNII